MNLARRNAMLTDVISHLEQYLQDTQGCDHSVGICACELRNTLDDFGVYCHTLTGGIVGWPNLRFDVDTDDPKQLAAEEASSAAEAMGNMRDIAMTMMQEMHDFRNRQLAREAAALKEKLHD